MGYFANVCLGVNDLTASLKDDTARMNDRNKHKVTGQINHQKADPKANASVFLFFPTAQMAHLVLLDTQANASQNQKSHFLPTLYQYN